MFVSFMTFYGRPTLNWRTQIKILSGSADFHLLRLTTEILNIRTKDFI